MGEVLHILHPEARRQRIDRASMTSSANPPSYVCWAPHHEDLTAQVLRVAREKAGKVFRLMTVGYNEEGEEAGQMIVVSCSEGHRNVFIVHIE